MVTIRHPRPGPGLRVASARPRPLALSSFELPAVSSARSTLGLPSPSLLLYRIAAQVSTVPPCPKAPQCTTTLMLTATPIQSHTPRLRRVPPALHPALRAVSALRAKERASCAALRCARALAVAPALSWGRRRAVARSTTVRIPNLPAVGAAQCMQQPGNADCQSGPKHAGPPRPRPSAPPLLHHADYRDSPVYLCFAAAGAGRHSCLRASLLAQ